MNFVDLYNQKFNLIENTWTWISQDGQYISFYKNKTLKTYHIIDGNFEEVENQHVN